MTHRALRNRPTRLCTAALIGALAVLAIAGTTPAAAQGSADGMRFGVTLGGISSVGVVVEWFDGNRAIDLTVGTFSFNDLSVSVVAKRYFGDAQARPYVGGGLWLAFAKAERLGTAIVLRAPVGVDWAPADRHSLGAAINVSRALLVHRTDPQDDLPMTGAIVPLPGFYYRYERR